MYEIEPTEFGYELTFGGEIGPTEMRAWKADSEEVLTDAPDEFHVFVDMRTLRPLDDEPKQLMQDGQQQYKESGMVRSVVILDSPTTTLQFRRIAKESGIYDWERYVDASSTENWRALGMEWLEHANEPDQELDESGEEISYRGDEAIDGPLVVEYRSAGRTRQERWDGETRIRPGDTYMTELPVESDSRIRIRDGAPDGPIIAQLPVE